MGECMIVGERERANAKISVDSSYLRLIAGNK